MALLLQTAATFSRGTSYKLGFVALAYLDLALTIFAVGHGFTEMNPFMARLLSRPGELVVVKGLAPLLIAWLAPGKLLLPAIALLAAVTGWNLRELLALL